MHTYYLAAADGNLATEVGPRIVYHLWGFPISDTLITAWVVSLALIIFSFIVTRNLKMVPSGLQNVMELLLESIMDLIDNMLPGRGKKFLPFIATIALFVGVSNLVGIIPLVKNPTADLNTTLALGLTVFVVSQVYGAKKKGVWNYLKGFAEPIFVMLPINIIGELAKPVSHSFRLFGNIFGGGILLGVLAQFVPGPALVPVPLMAWFDVFVGLIQALVFFMLAIAYIAIASEV
ncbi:MAG: F0F1 ATP synthase subunit A [Halanaerobium sp.]|nr:F0F1 ATP synthase subunit A [Halanaerobium sp.]